MARANRSSISSRRSFALLGVGLALGGCGKKSRLVVGMVPKGATQIFWQSVHAGALKAAKEFNVEIAWNAPAQESDRSRQIAIVDSMINRRVDAIALAPVDRKALVNVVERGIGAGIPVAIFDSNLDSDRIVSYIATDNAEGGRVAARRMAAALKDGKGKVAIIDDMPGSASTAARVNGFLEEAKAKFPGLEILPVQYCNADRAKARAIAENLLTANADLAGIFADHENAAIGAALALAARQSKSTRLIGFDSSEQLLLHLKEGWIDSLVVQNPFRMGYETIRVLAQHLAKQSAPKQIDTGSTLVTADNMHQTEIEDLLNPDLKTWLATEPR